MSNESASAALPAGISANAFSSLFQAVNGLRNRSALTAMIGCAVVGVLVAGLLFGVAGGMGAFLGFLICVVAVGTGVNAAGTLHMDAARGISPRSTVDALVFGLMCIPKLIVLGLALFAVAIGVYIVLAILFFICKIPALGTMLFAVVFPTSVVIAGIVTFGVFVCMALSLPAIWQGAGIMRALAQTLAIARHRLVEAVLLLVFVGLLGFAVSLVVFSVLGFGLVPTLGMSASIMGFGGSFASGMMDSSHVGGPMFAGVVGMMVLWAIAVSFVAQVHLYGLCLVYLRVTEGLDLTASEEALRRSFDDARRRTAELGDKARNAAQRATAGSAVAAGSAAAAGSSAAAPFTPNPAHEATIPTRSSASPASAPQPAPSPMEVSAPFFPPESPHELSQPPYVAHDGGTDIDISFDDAPAPSTATPALPLATFGSTPPAYLPAPVPPAAAPSPAAAPAPVMAATCPQCLSPVTPGDLFCGVCGDRLK